MALYGTWPVRRARVPRERAPRPGTRTPASTRTAHPHNRKRISYLLERMMFFFSFTNQFTESTSRRQRSHGLFLEFRQFTRHRFRKTPYSVYDTVARRPATADRGPGAPRGAGGVWCVLCWFWDPRDGTSPGGKEGRRKSHKNCIMPHRPIYLYAVNYCEQVVHSR